MTEREISILSAQCIKCKYSWTPFGKQGYVLPYTHIIKCPKCDYEQETTWYDSETKKKKMQKDLGLTSEEQLQNKIIELEKKFSLLEKELEIEKQKREIDKTELQNVKEWAKAREKDFKEIELIADEERQRMTDNEDMR